MLNAIVGHDGDTIGQSAYLRIDPAAGIAACLLTNSVESESLYREVFNEVFGDLTGVTMPAAPCPAHAVARSGSGPGRTAFPRAPEGPPRQLASTGTPAITSACPGSSTCRSVPGSCTWC